ncbi:MAG: M15 family metallopeptidase [bacterium]|nr:M15 family metallopeptidase [bacterium]
MRKIITIIIILFFIFLGCSKEVSNEFSKLPFYKEYNKERYIEYKKRNSNKSNYTIINEVNIGIYRPFYNNTALSNNIDTTYVLVNKYNYLNKEYTPNNLVNIDYTSMQEVASIAFNNLKKEALKSKLNIVAISGYRSYSYQSKIYNSYVKLDGIQNADTYSARPGYSEHQTGLAVDVSNGILPYTDFEKTAEYKWMIDNAYKYGFILRYPKEKEYITGYTFESWHYRYVGIEISSYMKKHDITFEEYYAMFIE